MIDAEVYLRSLPRRTIATIAADVLIPRAKSVGQLSDYNGFTGKERLRTFEVAKWLAAIGAMPHSGQCSICGSAADQQHAEDYFDLTTWMDICRGCHSSLHSRFRTPAAWQRRLDKLEVPQDHWSRRLPEQQPDIAAYHRTRGVIEPTHASFTATQTD